MTTPRPARLRRSELATPASSEWMHEKAAQSEADLVFLDLEDAVAPSAKVSSRAKAIEALNDLDWGRTVRAVRINSLETPWVLDDIVEIVTGARENLDMLIVPKATAARDVWWVDVVLSKLETSLGLIKRIGLEVLIEEAEGLINAEAIARSSDRLEAVIFGAGDFSASQAARVDTNFDPVGDYPGDFWVYARNKIVVAARAAGLDVVDSPFPNYQATEQYRRDAQRAALLGYNGKWCIHPAQIPIANEVFAPTPDEIAHARKVTETYEAAQAEGRGAIGVDGMLVDAAHLRHAANIMRKAELLES